ncbi:MAG: enoyl-CoA hydratase/isomerase family protein [Chloroflexi bacterium]|nr:enoyl-CoA hydratase/isomerase family protein [Chloroflexota bacterium]
MSTELVLYEKRDGVAYMTLNRPEKLNALNDAILAEFVEKMDIADADRDLRVIVLRGAGRAFSAGGDLAEIHETDKGVEGWMDFLHEQLISTHMRVWRSPKCVIAAVHGYCITGGWMLASLCDIILDSEDAKFGNPDARAPAVAVHAILPYLIGPQKTKELFFTGKFIDAFEAERMGFVLHVYPKDRFWEEVDEYAREIAKMPPIGIRVNKRAINRIYEIMGLMDAYDAFCNYDTLAHLWHAAQPADKDFGKWVQQAGLGNALARRDKPFKG